MHRPVLVFAQRFQQMVREHAVGIFLRFPAHFVRLGRANHQLSASRRHCVGIEVGHIEQPLRRHRTAVTCVENDYHALRRNALLDHRGQLIHRDAGREQTVFVRVICDEVVHARDISLRRAAVRGQVNYNQIFLQRNARQEAIGDLIENILPRRLTIDQRMHMVRREVRFFLEIRRKNLARPSPHTSN